MGTYSLILPYILLSIIQITLSDVFVYNNSNKLVENFDDQEGSFEPSIPSDGLTGYITTTDPIHACAPIAPPPNIPTSGYQWIALIPRTRGSDICEFTVKIQNAYNAHFNAVIIYNYDDSLISMGPYGSDVKIPSTLVKLSTGLTIINKYLYSKTSVNATPIYHIKIAPEKPFQFGYYLIPFVSIIALSFLGLIGFMLVKWHLQRRRLRRHRLPKSALKALKIKKFVKTDPWEVCAICLDDYEDGAKLRILPCQHAYHMKCIDPWLLNNRRQCPVCKRYVFPNRDNSDEEQTVGHQQTRTTERTPLINQNDNTSESDVSRNQQSPERQIINPVGSGVPNVSFATNESSDDEKDSSLPSSLRTTTTTAEVIFDRSSLNGGGYGSMNSSSITPRVARFFVGSSGGTTDNTNASTRSILEPASDVETTDNDDDDERLHSVASNSGENPAYINDEHLINSNQTHL